MTSIQIYVIEKLFIIIVGTLNCTFAFGITNHAAAFLMRRQVGLFKIFCGTLIMSLLFNAPLFINEYLFHYPKMSNMEVYSFFIFPMPLMLPVYYWIYRKIFGFTSAETIMSLQGIMLSQFLTMLMYMAFTDVWVAVLEMSMVWPYLIRTDVMAMMTTDIVVGGMYLVLRWVVARRGYYWEIPYNYVIDKLMKRCRSVFVSVTGSYVLLMAACVFLMSDYRSIINLSRTVLYSILAMVLGARLVGELNKVKLEIAEMEAKATSGYIDSLMRTTNDFRGIKHDINNILQVYEGYIAAGDLVGLKKYHQAVMKTTQQINDSLVLIEALRPRAAVYNLLNLKISLAQSVGVCVEVEGAEALCGVSMGDLDLCRVLSDLLDNGIGVAGESEEKMVRIACAGEGGMVRIGVWSSAGEGMEGYGEAGLNTARDTLKHYGGGAIGVQWEEGQFCAYVYLQPHA